MLKRLALPLSPLCSLSASFYIDAAHTFYMREGRPPTLWKLYRAAEDGSTPAETTSTIATLYKALMPKSALAFLRVAHGAVWWVEAALPRVSACCASVKDRIYTAVRVWAPCRVCRSLQDARVQFDA